MKKKYKFRKQFQQVLTALDIRDEVSVQTPVNKITNQQFYRLFNAQRTVIRAMMHLDLEKQAHALQQLKSEVVARDQKREKDNQELVNG
jgi:hypothetical protein